MSDRKSSCYSSIVRNNIFLSKVKEEIGKEIELHFDVKTRWNSIVTMIEPLIKAETAIRHTLNKFQAGHIIENFDFPALKTMHQAMEPVKLAITNLSREDATLITAHKILEFMFTKLSAINSDFSRELQKNLKKRVDDRMNTDLMNLLLCLKDPTSMPSEKTLKFAANLSSRLFGITLTEGSTEEENKEVNNEHLSLQEELNLILQKDESPKLPLGEGSEFRWLKAEFALFRKTGQRTENLQKLFSAMLCLKPTSTDVERVFSVSGNFCNKIRSRLSDRSLQALVFLKYFYKK